MKILLM